MPTIPTSLVAHGTPHVFHNDTVYYTLDFQWWAEAEKAHVYACTPSITAIRAVLVGGHFTVKTKHKRKGTDRRPDDVLHTAQGILLVLVNAMRKPFFQLLSSPSRQQQAFGPRAYKPCVPQL